MLRTVVRSLILLFSFAFASCSNEKAELIAHYQHAHNTHQSLDSVMAHYADSVQFSMQGFWVKQGKAEIRRLESWDSVLNSEVNYKILNIVGDTVICRVEERNDWYQGMGIDKIVHQPTLFIVKDQKIVKILGFPSSRTRNLLSAKLKDIYQLGVQSGDSVLLNMFHDDISFDYSAHSAEQWKRLLDYYENKVLAIR